jgi:AcrR family transcriptional regulator
MQQRIVKHMMNSRRKNIINAAQEIFSQKGISYTNVSEIADKAGVVDSILYHYFKNKEDILFSSLADKMVDVINDLNLHLEGIEDPPSMLRKMIWFHLFTNDKSPSDAQNFKYLLFECRSRKNFYLHNAYKILRNYTNIMLNILKKGVEDGFFRSDIDIHLARDLIFGILDEETIYCFISHQIYETLPDLNDIMFIIQAMILKNDNHNVNFSYDNDKKERILVAAKKIFAEKGFSATTISEIAVTANVAEGTIYSYFENKKDLLFSISKIKFGEFSELMDDVFVVTNPLRKFCRFLRFQFNVFLSDREFLKIFLLDNKLNKEFYKSEIYNDFLNYTKSLDTILEEGKAMCIFSSRLNARICRHLVIGALTHLSTRWLIVKDEMKDIDIMREIDQVVIMLSRAVISKNYQSYEDNSLNQCKLCD